MQLYVPIRFIIIYNLYSVRIVLPKYLCFNKRNSKNDVHNVIIECYNMLFSFSLVRPVGWCVASW